MRLVDADEFINYLGLDCENSREDDMGEIVTLEDIQYDSESIQMIIQDFCARQSNIIMEEIFDFIKNNFTDMRSLKSQEPGIFECNKENIGDYINRVYESECHNRYIRVPSRCKIICM